MSSKKYQTDINFFMKTSAFFARNFRSSVFRGRLGGRKWRVGGERGGGVAVGAGGGNSLIIKLIFMVFFPILV